MSFQNNSIYWIEVEKIKPNPYQPRKDFDQGKLLELADSIRQYGVLQPLVVTRTEVYPEEGGMVVRYELIAGERRLRAAKIAGVLQVPVVVRDNEEDGKVKLELAIIENLQREDLNPVDRARAFHRLYEEFGYKHGEIGKKVGKSREYVSNTVRMLGLPEDMMSALAGGRIVEGHTRPLLMLSDRPDEQRTLFKEILLHGLKVRDAERISRRIAYDRARKKERMIPPEIIELEEKAGESLGTRVYIEEREKGGKILIDYFSEEDLHKILSVLNTGQVQPSVSEIPEVQEQPVFVTYLDEESFSGPEGTPDSLDSNEEEELYSASDFTI